MLDYKVSLDTKTWNFVLENYPLKVIPRTLEPVFRIYVKLPDFLMSFSIFWDIVSITSISSSGGPIGATVS